MDDTPRIAELRKKVDKDPGSRLFAQLAEELRKEGRFDDAIEVARTGLEKNPNYPSARLTLARAHLDSNRPGEALPELEQVVKASPDNILASRLLGEALQSLGQRGEAIRQFERTLLLSPEDKVLSTRLEELRGMAARPVAPTVSAISSPSPPAPPSSPVQIDVVHGSSPLDRDLASGSYRPGSFSLADLPPRVVGATPATDGSPGDDLDSLRVPETIPFTHFEQLAAAAAAPETRAAEEAPAPLSEAGPGNQTLPVSSLTLADLYMKQGLKTEASAILSQVLLDEPGNAQARSKLEAVSSGFTQAQAGPAEPFADLVEASAGPSAADLVPDAETGNQMAVREPAPTRAEVRDRSILWLKGFLGAVEREAVHQRATERGAV